MTVLDSCVSPYEVAQRQNPDGLRVGMRTADGMNFGTVAENARADSTGFVNGIEMLTNQEVLVPPFGRRQTNILSVPFSYTRTRCEWMGGRSSVRVATSSDEIIN